MPPTIVMLGSPTALGGHIGGMERTPEALRRAGLVDRLRARPGLAGRDLLDAGDVPNDPGWAPDPDPQAKNRSLINAYLPVLAERVAAVLAGAPDARLHAIGGDCTTHAGVMAGLVRILGGRLGRRPRIAIAWFDAHGDFNTPDTTPSGNVWGMPFAMVLGRGAADLVAACDGPTAREDDAALLGGQVLDEEESRMLAASQVSHFGAGMLATDGGQAALRAWGAAVGSRCDGLYIAFDLDAIDEAEGLSLTMPEPHGISVSTALASVQALAGAMPVLGIGTTAALEREGLDMGRTAEVAAGLVEVALGSTSSPGSPETGPEASTEAPTEAAAR